MGNQDFETARLIVRLGAIAENYSRFRRAAGAATVAGVVKADAYGLGMAPVARALADSGCDTFFVARLKEGIALRRLMPDVRIFILDGIVGGCATALVNHRLVPVLNSLEQIASWSNAARTIGARLDAAVHIDTGMRRLGLPTDELATLVGDASNRLAGLNVVLWMSHLSCGDDVTSHMNAQQLARFRAALAQLPPAPASLAASGGALLGRQYVFDMVRPGIGLYGGNPASRGTNPMQMAVVLLGRILQLQRIDRGESVGYGATFQAMRPSRLATVGLGYADGLMRAIGNRGEGAIAGLRAPIVGRVSMDLVTLDVTDLPAETVAVSSEVEFLGEAISLEEFASWAGTASYEVLTTLGSRMPRTYEDAR